MCPECGAPCGEEWLNEGFDDDDRLIRERVCENCGVTYSTAEVAVAGASFAELVHVESGRVLHTLVVLLAPWQKPGWKRRPKTVCKRGHAFDDRNTYRHPSGRRHCRLCKRGDTRRWRRRSAHPAAPLSGDVRLREVAASPRTGVREVPLRGNP